MALTIHIKKEKKIIVNGAVLENASGRTLSFILKNEANVLRCEDVLSPEERSTPVGRIYYALQCLYLFPERRALYAATFSDLIESYRQAAPSASAIIDQILMRVRAGQFYDALKITRKLARHEAQCLSALKGRSDLWMEYQSRWHQNTGSGAVHEGQQALQDYDEPVREIV